MRTRCDRVVIVQFYSIDKIGCRGHAWPNSDDECLATSARISLALADPVMHQTLWRTLHSLTFLLSSASPHCAPPSLTLLPTIDLPMMRTSSTCDTPRHATPPHSHPHSENKGP